MKSILKISKSFFLLDWLILFFSSVWIVLNVYFLPFHIWDAGVMRPWYMLHGYLPYRDFTWIRMPLDLFLLSWWYWLVGVIPQSYQSFYVVLVLLVLLVLFLISRYIFGKNNRVSFLFFLAFLFPLFQNTEIGELLIGLFNMLLFGAVVAFFRTKSTLFLFLAGLIAGLAFITKQNSILVTLLVYGFLLYKGYVSKEKIRIVSSWILFFSAGILIPVSFLLSYFFIRGGLSDFFYYTIYFLLGKYVGAPVTKGDGGWIIASYIVLLVPLFYQIKKVSKDREIVIFLILQILCLFSSLFPSFLSYRAFTSFPLVSLAFGFIFLQRPVGFMKWIVFSSVIGFIVLNMRFIGPYFSSVQDVGFAPGQYLVSYGKEEFEVSKWINENTESNEKIINYGSEMIYLFADRLPKNKYVEPFPYLLQPYDVSTKIFTDNPPLVVVYDKSLPADHRGLDKWPFLTYLNQGYEVVGTYGDNLVIYQLKR